MVSIIPSKYLYLALGSIYNSDLKTGHPVYVCIDGWMCVHVSMDEFFYLILFISQSSSKYKIQNMNSCVYVHMSHAYKQLYSCVVMNSSVCNCFMYRGSYIIFMELCVIHLCLYLSEIKTPGESLFYLN